MTLKQLKSDLKKYPNMTKKGRKDQKISKNAKLKLVIEIQM